MLRCLLFKRDICIGFLFFNKQSESRTRDHKSLVVDNATLPLMLMSVGLPVCPFVFDLFLHESNNEWMNTI